MKIAAGLLALFFASLPISKEPLPHLRIRVDFVPAIVKKIARQEGFFLSDSLPRRLNNPGSLVFAKQRGAVLGERASARFRSERDGWRALERDVRAKLA